jgi:hypothetical protein
LDKAGQKPTDESRKWRRKIRKARLIALKGGCCERCNQPYPPCVFDFHHRNPAFKEVGLNQGAIGDHAWDWVLSEADKCHLLCANCHRLVHEFPDLRFLEEPLKRKKKPYDKSLEAGPGQDTLGTPAI